MACVKLQYPHSTSYHCRSLIGKVGSSAASSKEGKPCLSLSFLCSDSLRTLPSSFCSIPSAFVARSSTPKSSSANETANEFPSDLGSDSGSDSDSDRVPKFDELQELAEEVLSHDQKSSPTPLPVRSEEISWLLMEGEDVATRVSNLSISERYAPHRLLEFVTKQLDSHMLSLAQLKSTLKFWEKKKKLQEDPTFGSSAFEGKKGVSQLYQWTATELTLQHAQLSRISRDVLYLILACTLLGVVRVLEAVAVTFSSRPPRFAKLLDAMNSLDFFTVAFLAYSLRKPIVGILHVDPTSLDEIVHLKAKIWEEMHKFYERQWKVIATLGIGRLLALVAKTLPSTNALTKSVKMCWDMLLALPIF